MAKSTKSFDYTNKEALFNKTFSQLKNLPNGITKKRSTTPVNLFEGIAVGAALALQTSDELNLENTEEWISGEGLFAYISGATNSRLKVVGRIDFCKNKFLGK